MRLLLECGSVRLAYRLAKDAHKGQTDKGGHPYIGHPVAVAEMLDTEEEQVTALLHDIVEDTPVSLSDLSEKGFSERVVSAVDALTKRNGETLEEYLVRVRSDSLALKVKLADLSHNSDLSRIKSPTKEDLERTERYKKEAEFLR